MILIEYEDLKEIAKVLLMYNLSLYFINNLCILKVLQLFISLKLSEDKTKVSRIAPFRLKSEEEVDLCTVYVVSKKELLVYSRNKFYLYKQEILPPVLQLNGLNTWSGGIIQNSKMQHEEKAVHLWCDSESAAKAVTVSFICIFT